MRQRQPPHELKPPSDAGDQTQPETSFSRWGRGFLLGQLVGTVLGPFIRLIAAVFLGAGAVFLILAWQIGPQQAVDAARYTKYTKQVQGQIVESWLAVELDTTDIRVDENWWYSSLATPCAVVEYASEWGPPTRRAFCGKRLTFTSSYTLHDLGEVTPGVPFVWARDASGLIVPEIRVSAQARQWLATHGYDTFMHRNWPAKSALDELRIELDRPVDDAVAGWIAPAAKMPLALDPQRPAEAMPAGFAAAHAHWHPGVLILCTVVGAIGLALWFEGMTVLLGENLALPARLFIAVLPLLALPRLGEYLPQALSHLNARWAYVISGMLRDTEGLDRLVASEPADATLAGGDRLVWRADQSIYADTFGRLHYVLPQPAPRSADAALAALAQTVTTQTRALGEAERIDIFSHLKRDSEKDLVDAGIVFLPAAKEAALDPVSSPALRRAAKDFVYARLLGQFGRPYPRDLGYQERERLYDEARKFEATQ